MSTEKMLRAIEKSKKNMRDKDYKTLMEELGKLRSQYKITIMIPISNVIKLDDSKYRVESTIIKQVYYQSQIDDEMENVGEWDETDFIHIVESLLDDENGQLFMSLMDTFESPIHINCCEEVFRDVLKYHYIVESIRS